MVEIKVERCISCGVPLKDEGYTVFKCPSCNNEYIGRCEHCRDQAVEYECPSCHLRGP